MMGQQDPPQKALFHYGFDLESRVRADHPLRRIEALIDFDFVSNEVEDLYGHVGRVSVPPPTILKLMFLLFFYDVRSERELLATLPERLDWLWFLRFDIETAIPDHSVLSKARRRWGAEAFRKFFERIVWQCREAGIVEGGTVFCDSSLIEANASIDSIVTAACLRLDEDQDESEPPKPKGHSTTDRDAAVVSKRGQGPARARYKTHRAVDGSGVVTATSVTPGDVDEGSRLGTLIDEHQRTTGLPVDTVVADSQYGTIDNLLACSDRGIRSHMRVRSTLRNLAAERGVFDRSYFEYDEQTDTLRCPTGATLRRAGAPDRWGLVPYNASARDCRRCPLKSQCTNSTRRTVRRHTRQSELDRIVAVALSKKAQTDLIRRQTLVEGSFGQATRYHLKRARYRGLRNMAVQDLIIATIQNILLICCCRTRPKAAAAAHFLLRATLARATSRLSLLAMDLLSFGQPSAQTTAPRHFSLAPAP